MKIPKMYKHEYVTCLPRSLEHQIMTSVKRSVSRLALSPAEKEKAIDDARCEKVCNLTDTIDIEFI